MSVPPYPARFRPRDLLFDAKYNVRPSGANAGDESHASGSLMFNGIGSDHLPLRNRDMYRSTSLEPLRLPVLPLANTIVRPSGVKVRSEERRVGKDVMTERQGDLE